MNTKTMKALQREAAIEWGILERVPLDDPYRDQVVDAWLIACEALVRGLSDLRWMMER